MRTNSAIAAAIFALLESAAWAYQDGTHEYVTDQAVQAVPATQYPDIARYAQSIRDHSHGFLAEGYAHGGPDEPFWQRELDWTRYDGGPVGAWLDRIQQTISSPQKPSDLLPVYERLGYVSHLIEDQTSPPHTANIGHGMFDHFESQAGTPPISLQVRQLSLGGPLANLAQYYTDAFKDSKGNLPSYVDPVAPIAGEQYWPVCDPAYLGEDHTSPNCKYGGILNFGPGNWIYNQDTFSVGKSPNIVPAQASLAVGYVTGILENFSSLMPPFAFGASVGPAVSDGSSQLTLNFHAMHNRVNTLTLTAEILRADGSDTGQAAFSNTSISLSGGVVLPWEADLSMPWTPSGLADGTYELSLVLTDDKNNTSTPVLSNTFTIDSSQPNSGPSGPPSGFPPGPDGPQCAVLSADAGPSGICSMTLSGGPPGFQAASISGSSSYVQWGPWCPDNLPGGCYVETITSCLGKSQSYSFCVPTVVPAMTLQANGHSQSTPITATMIANDKLRLTSSGGSFYAIPGGPAQISNACQMIALTPGGQCQSSCSGGECGVSEVSTQPLGDVGFSVSNKSNPYQATNAPTYISAQLVSPNGTIDAGLSDTLIPCPQEPNACAITAGSGNVSFTTVFPTYSNSSSYSNGGIRPLDTLTYPNPPTITATLQTSMAGVSVNTAPLEDSAAALSALLAQVVPGFEFTIGGSTAIYFAKPAQLQMTVTNTTVSPLAAIYQHVGHSWQKISSSSISFSTTSTTATLSATLTQGGAYAALYYLPDKLPPRTTIIYGDPSYGTYLSPMTLISLSAVDDYQAVGDGLLHAATTTFSVDGNPFAVYTSSFTISTPGSHTIRYYSSDTSGNVEAVNSATVIVTSPPPTPTVLANGSNPSPWSNTGIYTLSVTTTSNGAGVLMTLGKACAPPQSNDDGAPLPSLTFQPPCLSQGINPLYIWSMDYVGSNDYRTAASVALRFDNITPSSFIVSPSTASSFPVMLTWSAADPGTDATPPTGSGIAQTILWYRHDNSDDGNFGPWQQAFTLTSTSGTAAFNPTGEGNYQFYTQAVDNAGNAEPSPDTTTVAKATGFFDNTPPLISAVSTLALASSAGQIQWTTDDLTTGYVDYGTTTALGSRVSTGNPGRAQTLILNGLPYPATIYFRITAVNKTQLQAATPVMSFATPPLVTLPTNPFGVVTSTQSILVQINNPGISSGSFTIDGQSGTLVPGTTNVFQITLSTGLTGSQTLTINVGGFIYNTSFIVDTATRSVRVARLVIDGGGVMTSTQTTPGISMLDASAGEVVVGPPSDQSPGLMSSGQSRLMLGYYSGIDPVAPGEVSSLMASAGPGPGQVTLSWTAPGNDAYVGTAMAYDLRYSTLPITDAVFAQASSVALSTYPALAGTTQQALASGLADGTTYYFALKTLDGLLNESSISNIVSTGTYSVARSTDLTGGHTTVTLISNVSGVSISLAASTGTVPAVALATSAAAAQGLLFASPIYDIQSPLNPLPGGATIQFYYDPTGLDPTLQSQLRVYHLSANSTTWMLVADAAPILSQDLLVESVTSLSLFAIMLPDHLPPQTSLTTQGGRQFLSPSGSFFASTNTLFGLSARDPPLGRLPGVGVMTTEFRVDSATAALTALVPSTAVFSLTAGLHSIDFLSVDLAGNVAPLQSAVVGVDGAPPLVRVSAAAGAYAVLTDPLVVLSTATSLSLQIIDPLSPGDTQNDGAGVSTVAYSVDGGTFAVAGSSFSLTLGLGLHTLAVIAQDNVGNVLDRSTTPYHIIVGDAEPPRTALAISTPQASAGALAAAYVSRQTTFTLTSVDDLSAVGDGQGLGVAFQQLYVDGNLRAQFADATPGQGQVFLSTFSLATDSDGAHALGYLAQDIVQNRETLHITTVAVDNTSPTTQLLVSSPSFGAYVSSLTAISLLGTDPAVNGVASGLALTRYRDNSGTFQSYVSTFALAEGAHEIDFQSQDRVGNTELLKSATIFVDATPPATTVSIGSPTFTGSDGTLYIATTTPVSLAALDPVIPQIASGTVFSSGTVPGSGVSRIDVAIDSAAFSPYVSTLTFAEGRHVVQYRAVDNVGNVEPAHTLLVSVDATPPLVAFQVLGSSYTDASGNLDVSTQTALGFSSVDPAVNGVASGVRATQYQINGASFAVYAGTFTLPAPDGTRLIAFQATDNVGNTSLLKSATVFLDATPPITALSIGTPQFVSSGTLFVSTMTPFSLASADPVVGGVTSGVKTIFVAQSSSTFTAYVGTFTFAAPDGAKTASWYAVDEVGNAEIAKSSSVALDATAPQTSLALLNGGTTYASTAGVYVSSAARVVLSAIDPLVNGVASGLAWTRWQDNGGAFQVYASSLAFAEGSHTLGYQSQDNVANLEVLRSTTVLIDATPPVTTVAISSPTYTAPDGTLYVATTTPVSFAAADPALASSTVAGSGVNRIEVAVDSASFTPYVSALTFTEGAHVVLYRAVDNVGNVETAHLLALRADTTPPVSALVIGQPQFALSSATVLVSSLTPLGIAVADPTSNGVASGVRQSFYALDGGTFAVFAASFTAPAPDGIHVVSFYSQDNVLNTEAVKVSTIILDATPPAVALLSPGGCSSGVCRVVKGKFPVLGSATDAHFAGYELDFAPGSNATTGYALISSGTAVVSSSVLGTWDASPLSGWQTLRLTATDLVANVSVVAVNVFVGDPGELMILGNHDVFNMPQGVASDAGGNVYVADTNADRIAVFSATGAFITAYGQSHDDRDDHVSSTTVQLNKPKGVAVDAAGNIFIADTNENRVLKLSATGQVLLMLGRQTKPDKDRDGFLEFQPGKGLGEFNKPSGVALDATGNIYVADTNNDRVQVLSSTGASLLAFTLPPLPKVHDDEKADHDDDQPTLGRPFGLAVDAAGRIYVADPYGSRALVFGATGQLLLTLPIAGTMKDGHVVPGRPEGVAVSTDGYCLLVSDRKFDHVLKFDSLGDATLAFGVPGHYNARKAAGVVFHKPVGLALAADGTLLVADRNNDRVERFGLPTGKTLVVPPSDNDDPNELAQDVLDSDAGGTVARADKAGVTIPPGALPDDLKITVSTLSASGAAQGGAMDQVANAKGLAPAYAPVQYGPEGTQFNAPVTLVEPYDPNLVAASGMSEDNLAIHYWNPAKNDWEALASTVDKSAHTVTAKTPHFSLYQVLGSTGTGALKPLASADPTFTFHDAYAFPNPVRGTRQATIRIQPGLADSVEVRIYDLAGRKVHSSSDFQQNILDDGNGKGFQYTFDHVWDISGVGSGVYLYVITARKSGMSDIHKTGRVAVIK